MEELKVLKCKNCGQPLDLRNAKDGVIECDCCFSVFTLPKEESPSEATSYLRMGEHDLDSLNWSGAIEAFKKAAEKDKSEPEAYWGLALASYRVQYLKDLVNNRLQPISHIISPKKFVESSNYQTALKYATPAQRKEYQKKAAEIDYIKDEFLKLKSSRLEYDCFICVKVTDKEGNKTKDSQDADYIYDLLKRNGYKPFLSEREIRNKTGADYEARILYALHSCESMLVVCHNEEYLNTDWVKNEYTRFLSLVNDEEKDSDSITIVYNGTPIEKLEGKRGKIQGIDFSRRDADGDIIKFVDDHTPKAKAKREEAKRRKQAEEEEIRRQIEEQKKSQRELEEKLKNLRSNTGVGAVATVDSLMKRAKQEMESGDYDKARDYCNKVLDIDPENAEAWWGLFLCDFKISDENQLLNSVTVDLISKISDNRNFYSALSYCEENSRYLKFKDKLREYSNAFIAKANQRIQNLEENKRKLVNVADALPKSYSSNGLPEGSTVFFVTAIIFAIAWLVLMIVLSVTGKMQSTADFFKWGCWFDLLEKRIGPLSWLFFTLLFAIGYLLESLLYGIAVGIIAAIIFAIISSSKDKQVRENNALVKEYETVSKEIKAIEADISIARQSLYICTKFSYE